MTVCASMHMACDVRMHGWAIKYRTTSYDLPTSAPNPFQNHPHAMPPCLSHQQLGKDDPKGGSVAPGKKTLRCLTQESQEVQESKTKERFELTFFQLPLSPSRLVVVLSLLSGISQVPHLGPLPLGSPMQDDASSGSTASQI
jgi:hypothetical protein